MVHSWARRTSQASAITGPMLCAVRLHFNQGQHRVAGAGAGVTEIEFKGTEDGWIPITGRGGQGSHHDTFETSSALEITRVRAGR